MFMGLNPSTADETVNDNTIVREINFAKAWGCNALAKWNLFAFRATQPGAMKTAGDPVGPDNDKYLLEMARGARVIVAAWGNHGAHRNRDQSVLRLLSGFDVHCLKITQRGQPSHTLYLKSDLTPQLWVASKT